MHWRKNERKESRRQEWKNESTKEDGRCGRQQDKHQAQLKKDNTSIKLIYPEIYSLRILYQRLMFVNIKSLVILNQKQCVTSLKFFLFCFFPVPKGSKTPHSVDDRRKRNNLNHLKLNWRRINARSLPKFHLTLTEHSVGFMALKWGDSAEM